MDIKKISPFLSVSAQVVPADVAILASQGYRTIINNRPDGESDDQPTSEEIRTAAERHGMNYHAQPVAAGSVTDDDVERYGSVLRDAEGPVLAFCRTGTRSMSMWALNEAHHLSIDAILATATRHGYTLEGLSDRLRERAPAADSIQSARSHKSHDVVIVGGGAGGIACASSLLRRRPNLDILVLDPRDEHYYQPGWTLVGAGVFDRAITVRSMSSVMPEEVKWQQSAVAGFEPEHNCVILEDGERIGYRTLVVSPGIKLNWRGIEGLTETLGKNGVTSNYKFDLAPYTWELVQSLKGGRALFTQPPMPIKCAGAPQKALYLSCDFWRKENQLKDIDVEFYNAGGVLFGVPDYVPALEKYVESYGINLQFQHNLVAVDGAAKKVWFENGDDKVAVDFDMIHVCPPQTAPDFVRASPLADAAGWVDVSPETLDHPEFGNVFGLGDACSAPNAKTAAAVRKQAPVVAENVLSVLDGHAPLAIYDGYGSCPLTVERGKIVLAEFGYAGKLLPTLPKWLLDGTKPTRAAWYMKVKLLPWIYFNLMLKGREWLAEPELLPHRPTPHQAQPAQTS